jgi:predicted type IV restriction endonuclease
MRKYTNRMDRDAVEEYVATAQSTVREFPQMDEATTKEAVVSNFLVLLDWNVPEDTKLEYSVEAFGKTYKVDYALVLEGKPVAFIEAKGVDTALTDDHRNQLQDYLKNEEASLGILTNGEQYEFYRRDGAQSNLSATAELGDLTERVNLLKACSKQAIRNDESETILSRIEELQSARTELRKRKDEISNEVEQLIVGELSDVIAQQAESQSKELIDRLVEDIEREVYVPDGEDIEGEVDLSDESDQPVGGYVVRILDEGTVVEQQSDDNQSAVMAQVVNSLAVNYDLVSKLKPLPYVPGRSKPIIDDRPARPDDDIEMRRFRELDGGYYLNTHHNADGKKRTLRRLVKKCDLDVRFSGAW